MTHLMIRRRPPGLLYTRQISRAAARSVSCGHLSADGIGAGASCVWPQSPPPPTASHRWLAVEGVFVGRSRPSTTALDKIDVTDRSASG